MLFNRLGKAIVRHHKLIIVIWILALLVAIPFAPQAYDAVIYEETQGSSEQRLPSEDAQKWMEDNFGDRASTGSTIIALTSPDVLDPGTKVCVDEITMALIEASNPLNEDASIEYSIEVESVYTVVRTYTTGFLAQVNQVYFVSYDATNATRYVIFGVPLEFWSLYNETEATQDLVFGLPSEYAATWEQTNESTRGLLTIQEVDDLTYGAISSALLTSDPLAIAWLDYYSAAWNATRAVPSVANDLTSRTEFALDTGYAAFSTEFLSQLPPAQSGFIDTVEGGFTLDNWTSVPDRNVFVDDVFVQNLERMADGLSVEQAAMLFGYYSTFYRQWDSWNSTRAPADKSELEDVVTASVTAFSSSLPTREGDVFRSLYDFLGWEGWQDDALLAEYNVGLVSTATEVEPWLVGETAALGPTPSSIQVYVLAGRVVDNSSLSSFPLPLVPAMIDNFVNTPQNDTMIIALTFYDDQGHVVSGARYIEAVREVIGPIIDEHPGMEAYVTGGDAIQTDIELSVDEDVSRIDPVTIILILVLIGLFFRSFVAAAVPPMIIGIGLGISFALVYFLGTYFMDVHYSVLTILMTASLGAGCDYCIFILSRYREERNKGYDKKAAVETSVTWAGEAIATSGLTVIIAFGALSLSSMSYIASMGVLAVGIACALLLALTLLPAILVLLGDRIFWPSRLDREGRKDKESYFTRSARFSIKHAKALLIVAVLITIPTTYIVLNTPTSYDYIASMPDSESKDGLMVLEDGFGGGRIIPTYVGMDLSSSAYQASGTWNVTNLDGIEGLCAELASLENVEEVISPTRPYGEPIDYANVSSVLSIQSVLDDQYMRTMVGENSTAILITVVFVQEPFSPGCIEGINTIRELVATTVSAEGMFTAGYVAGGTATMYDLSVETNDDFLLIIPVVIVAIYIVLLLVLGSVLNPLRSILTILLSISWILAVTMVLFTYVFETPIMYMVPLMLLVVCLGLGMDYDILLSTRVREEASKGKDTNDSIVIAVGKTGAIITACGLIMAGAFGTMMLSEGWLLREFGFALMFAILLDALVVRIYLVPAIMSLLGKWNWWAPGRLQRTKITQRKQVEEDDWIKKALEELSADE